MTVSPHVSGFTREKADLGERYEKTSADFHLNETAPN